MKEKKRIHSKLLEGVVKDHDDHSEKAPMRSTGDIVLLFDGEENARNWFVEYKCDICGAKVREWHADTHDLVRQALRENGILK